MEEEGFRVHPTEYFEDGEGGVVAVVESCNDTGRWRMTGISANCDYGTAQTPRDGVDQLVADICDHHVHRRRSWLESRQGIDQVESETYDSCEDANAAARRWLAEQAH